MSRSTIRKRLLKTNYLRFVVLIAFALYSNCAISASNTILSSNTFFYQGNDGKLVVQFNVPMGYISHFPAKSAKTLKIRMKELFPSQQGIKDINDKLIISLNSGNPFSEILYEQAPAQNGELTIEFTRKIDFDIKMSRDRKSLTVSLKGANPKSNQSRLPESLSTGLPIYTLNLKTSSQPIDPNNQPALKNFSNYDSYITESRTQQRSSYTLQLGYFYSPSAAKANLKNLKPFYPQGWVSEIKPNRRITAENWLYNLKLKQLKKKSKRAKPEKLDLLIERARQAMLDKNYKQAIRLLTRILELGGGDYKKVAKEHLGLARERNGQFAHAKAEYQDYLKRYPEGEDAERVQQRLQGLLTAASRPKDKLKATTKTNEPEWDFFGGFFQFYRNQQSATDSGDSIETDSSLSSDLLFAGRKRGFEFNQRFNIAGSHRYDFLDQDDSSDGRLYTFYYDIAKRDNNYGGRIGRQSHSSDGVLGRFDGFIVNKSIGTGNKVNFLAGYPVELSTKDGINTERQFYALSVDFDELIFGTDFKFYLIDQTNSGLTDRRAIGTQLKFNDDTSSYFATLDYDTFFSELNQVTFIATWRNKENSSLNVVADYRKSPLITTNNALIGQTAANLNVLQQTFTDEQIYQFAKDRSGTYTSVTLSASTHLSDNYQLNGDITVSSLEGTIASGGVAATADTGTEYFYNTNLVINNFFTANDITIFGARYSNASTSDIIQLNFSSNFNLSKTWRINPRLIVDSRDNSGGSTRTTYKPRLIVHYRPSRTVKYELDMGYEDAETTSTTGTNTETNLYVFLGYIYDF